MNFKEAMDSLEENFKRKESTFLVPKSVIITENQYHAIKDEINRLSDSLEASIKENEGYETLVIQLKSESPKLEDKIRKLKEGIPFF